MPAGTTIHYLKQNEIDKQLWDRCIDHAENGLVYGYSWYLDHMADHWDGMVMNNYEAVLPLPWRKKAGIYYLYQPFLTAQLGLFGNQITADLLRNFLNAIPQKFKLWEFSLNHRNLFPVPGFELYERRNYILNLNQPYDILIGNYRENTRRNIKRSIQNDCYLRTGIEFNSLIALAKQQTPGDQEKDFNKISALYQYLKTRDQAKAYGIFSKQNELVSSAVFLFSHNRAYYLLVGNHPNGRTLGASHALIDGFIRDFASQNLILDFEGSDISNLAFFYESFGAKEEKYAAIKRNRLPWYLKWIKK